LYCDESEDKESEPDFDKMDIHEIITTKTFFFMNELLRKTV